jgi:hypothetical protein
MKDAERFLKDYWYATRSIGRLMMDLTSARQAYEQCQASLPVTDGYVKAQGKHRQISSPVERAVVIAVDQFHAEMLSIENRLKDERHTLAAIEQTVERAGLSAPEAGYVRLRYFEARSVEAAAQRLYCSVATCGRLRVSALGKIEHVLSADTQSIPACLVCSH